ncbi:hypothetical protein GCM10017643_13730 [Ancylobacter dichloromethanicus]|uniref:Uncharacterized protein n=1 Tax=Ancylobacter dichloromethanicus TaxID=518825 RepID=A0A9W6J8J6_9HYPH|nr:hypothetical protein GCM10017643_13730 [Ancylobacter dichloromethanicus]
MLLGLLNRAESALQAAIPPAISATKEIRMRGPLPDAVRKLRIAPHPNAGLGEIYASYR